MSKLLSVLLAFFIFTTAQLHADDDWSATGHRVVGKIATSI